MADGQRFRLTWKGAEVRKDVVAAASAGLSEFGLRHEGAAKGQLRKGHGVVTGTLRRSIHSAGVQYNFAGDDVPPSPGSPERGGRAATIAEKDGVLSVVTGSGMSYARKIEELYAYLSGPYPALAAQLPAILEKHARARGLT